MNSESAQDWRKPDCVVVDTSIWRSEPLLKSPLGVTLVYTLSRQGGFIGLPEIVESELKIQIVEAGLDAGEKAASYSRIVSTLTDDPHYPWQPTQDSLERAVEKRLSELTTILVREPFTLEHARAALAMVNAMLPPSGQNNQQYKDSAIWQAVLTLAGRFSAHLVTKDKGFFSDRDPSKGLAPNLVDDCRKAGVHVAPYGDVGSCLKAISGAEPAFDRNRVTALISEAIMTPLKTEAVRNRYEVRELLDTKVKAFRTENPSRIAIDYTITMRIEDDSSIGEPSLRDNARAVVHGSSYYDPKADTLAEHLIQQIALRHRGGYSARSFREYDAWARFPRPIDLE